MSGYPSFVVMTVLWQGDRGHASWKPPLILTASGKSDNRRHMPQSFSTNASPSVRVLKSLYNQCVILKRISRSLAKIIVFCFHHTFNLWSDECGACPMLFALCCRSFYKLTVCLVESECKFPECECGFPSESVVEWDFFILDIFQPTGVMKYCWCNAWAEKIWHLTRIILSLNNRREVGA